MRGISGTVAVVTGGASGIGAAAARRLVEEGAHVVIADIHDETGERLAEEIGAEYVHTNVADEASISAMVDTVVERFGRLDTFFANAAVFGAVGPVASLSADEIDATIGVNLRGVILSVKHAARVMVPAGRGSIIVTASPGGVIGGAGPHVYAATKGGVIAFARSTAAELRRHGVRVTSIVPGAIVSPMTADAILGDARAIDQAASAMTANSMMGRPGVPEDVAGVVAFLASDDAGYLTGSEVFVDAGYTYASGSAAFAHDRHIDSPALFEHGRRGIRPSDESAKEQS